MVSLPLAAEYTPAPRSPQAPVSLTWQEILATLTTNPAERLGNATRSGCIARGLEADLVVLSADPAQDVTAFSKVSFTIRHRKILFGKP